MLRFATRKKSLRDEMEDIKKKLPVESRNINFSTNTKM